MRYSAGGRDIAGKRERERDRERETEREGGESGKETVGER